MLTETVSYHCIHDNKYGTIREEQAKPLCSLNKQGISQPVGKDVAGGGNCPFWTWVSVPVML